MAKSILQKHQIEEIQNLYMLRIPNSQIARQYNITSPAVSYYTQGIPQADISLLVKVASEIKQEMINFAQHEQSQAQAQA